MAKRNIVRCHFGIPLPLKLTDVSNYAMFFVQLLIFILIVMAAFVWVSDRDCG